MMKPGGDGLFEGEEGMKGKSMEEVTKAFQDMVDKMIEGAKDVPGLVERVVAICQEGEANGCI